MNIWLLVAVVSPVSRPKKEAAVHVRWECNTLEKLLLQVRMGKV